MHKLLIVLTVFLFFAFPSSSTAANDFQITSNASYTVLKDGSTQVVQNIKIKNLTDFTYAPSYSISINYQDLGDVKVSDSGGSLIPFNIKRIEKDEGFVIEIAFKEQIVGKDKINDFSVSFITRSIAVKKGKTLEVTIPGITSESVFDTYSAVLTVPESFGQASIIKPFRATSKNKALVFNKDDLLDSGILILFGEVQKYNVKLIYHLVNSNLFPVKTEIALPPNTNYQDVIISNITEAPENVYRDIDGNWLAEYRLLPNQKKNISATLQISVYAHPKSEQLSQDAKNVYLQSDKYWEVNDPQILKKAKSLSSVEDIYKFVKDYLSYDYKKVNEANNRLGAKVSLNNPKKAVCLEFTDLFIALVRAKGIPARAVEGYAYTQNDVLRPLSLVEDILHAWPEYYDEKTKSWIMVDPTWGNTTGGIDYYNSLDFDHITFVIKGKSSTYPVPAGGYKVKNNSKDVFVDFVTDGNINETPIYNPVISTSFPNQAMSLFPIKGEIILENKGTLPIIDKAIEIETDLPLKKRTIGVAYLPPFGKQKISVDFGKVSILTNNTYTFTIHFDGKRVVKKINIYIIPEIEFLALGGGIIVSTITLIIVALKARRIFVQK